LTERKPVGCGIDGSGCRRITYRLPVGNNIWR